LVEQQKIDIAEESTTSVPTAKRSKKENTNEGHEGSILETKKGKDQDNASGQGLEDLKEADLKDNEAVG
jgi:hypothetical protein